ncbi:MAG: anthranilate phosphoribosyltransferase [Deltaproteobacteria bacterium]|nr:anthranilate phosphoribosyltransferase [Deltaproteobacteria bacterium]
MIKKAIGELAALRNLTEQDMMAALDVIMEGAATPAQIASFITALRMKGETVDEVTGAARIMRRRATRVDARSSVIVDTCGTGGDGVNTFNISTAAAFVVAASGITVAKHGNRAVSSRCGSADVLEALGVKVDADPEIMEECLHEAGIGFLFAPRLHAAMKHAVGPRREIGIRTIFNMLGPLTNPAGATAQLLGVFDARITEMFAAVLRNLGARRAYVVHGFDGLDEATVTAETRVSELRDGTVRTYNIDPVEIFGRRADIEELRGGTIDDNASILRGVLEGEQGPRRNIVLLNAALAVMAGEKAGTLADGIAVAAESIDSGRALKKLEDLIECSNR